jgi:hypothetical protein
MAPKLSQHQLLQDLHDDNLFFDALVDMIPVRLYVAGNSGDDYNPKYFKGQAKESKEARRALSKQAKRAKLDPSLSETTTEAKKRLEGNRPLIPSAPSHAAATADSTADSSVTTTSKPPSSADTSADTAADTTTDADAADTTTTTAAPAAPPAAAAVAVLDNKSRIEALREKLRDKLAAKRAQRPTDPNVVSKRAARRTEKKNRKEEAMKRKKKATSNAETTARGGNNTYRVDAATKVDAATDLAQMDFGRLAGLNQPLTGNYQKANKSLANMSKTKNLQKLLADAEDKKQRLEELKKGTEDDKEKATKILWGDTIKEAAGDRIKDDPAKLRKALKKRDVKKKKSAKAWKSRMDQTKEKMDGRQKIRNHNLTARKLGGSAGANLSSKKIATEDDGAKKSRPGFEGRKQGFLNTKKDPKKDPKKDQ